MDIQFERAGPEDVDVLIDVQNRSFYADFVKYGVCPGYNRSRDSMSERISRHHVYKILCDGAVVGDFIVRDYGNGHYHLGCICVVPEFESRGIGQRAMGFIDRLFPDARHWSLDTPADKRKNLYFYKKHGYKITRECEADGVRLSFFEKDV